MGSNEKGDRRERELVNELYDRGWGVMRAPASGSATERELPDVLCGNGEYFFVIEVKASARDNTIYLDEEEVEALLYFADCFGGHARVGARFDYEDWAFFNPRALHRTPSGNYRVKHEALEERPNQTLEDLETGPL